MSLARSGMVLAKEVATSGSSVLICVKGVLLTEELILKLREIEIQSIVVEGHPATLPGGDLSMEELVNLEHRFKQVQNDPRMMRIKGMFKKNLIVSRKDYAK